VTIDHREIRYEDAVENGFLAGGYSVISRDDFDRERGVWPDELVAFVRDTQSGTWALLERLHHERAASEIVTAACKEMDALGSLHVLRHGFKVSGKPIMASYQVPSTDLNPDAVAKFRLNRVAMSRQVPCVKPSGENGYVDVVLAINGIPFATLELKNELSGQRYADAIEQYRKDRDPREPLFAFKKRALVHFAVDTDEAWMTTRLSGNSTRFIPFNKGRDNGAGNPDAPEGHYKVGYLWETALERTSALDIIHRFIHLQTKQIRSGGIIVSREDMVFPRYHQLDSVRKMVAHAKANGPGHNYLVEHSAGSGKSNSIAWLAHHLASLHDERDEKVFDSVVVITDRLVLDQQLQETIYQFEHKSGVVQKIDEDSTQLTHALEFGTPIIISTIQKFGFVTDKIGTMPSRCYAVIVDEAHSSQSGESASELKRVLSKAQIEELAAEEYAAYGDTYGVDSEDILRAVVTSAAKRAQHANLSFFAFTATPKYKTLELFGTPNPETGKPEPFHLYSMKQAIQEGFILDVLRHYTTYKAYFQLIKTAADDPEYEKKAASRALARFLQLHPYNIAQKVEIIVEHFRAHTMHKIGGRAKAMIVTSGREAAVRYKHAVDAYLNEKGYGDIKALVAFSGAITIDGVDHTEPLMNGGIGVKELPEKFSGPEYQVLIVAEKYQTGFDEPLLHTMYVDKKLDGVHAVQTLSRLNRVRDDKTDTFVLDFVNEAEDIQKSFEPYYVTTTVGEQVDPDQLDVIKEKLFAFQVFSRQDVTDFAAVFFKPRAQQAPADHARLDAIVGRAKSEFLLREEEEREEFKTTLVAYRNLYAFVSQILPYLDVELETLYAYARFLIRKLPGRDGVVVPDLEDDVALKAYRLERTADDVSIPLGPDFEGIKPPMPGGRVVRDEEKTELSKLVEAINEKFALDWTDGDQLFIEAIIADVGSQPDIQQKARVNSLGNFMHGFTPAVEVAMIDRMESNGAIVGKYLDDPEFKKLLADYMARQVYEQARAEAL
jgi:type I restriction enzyme R subunit